jgi:hypothetical protein
LSTPTNKTTTDAIARLEKRVEALEAALREMADLLFGVWDDDSTPAERMHKAEVVGRWLIARDALISSRACA